MESGVTLLGGFPSEGSPSLEQRDWSVHATITEVSGLDAYGVIGADHATLDGFTILGSEIEWEGGVYCVHASPNLLNCTIAGNRSDDGGGVYCYHSSPTLSNCTISNNEGRYGGGVYCYDASPVFLNCTIADNAASSRGGGLYCSYSSPTLVNCIVSGNQNEFFAGALYCCDDSSPSLINCTLADNLARESNGLYCEDSCPVLTNCILWNRGNEIEGASAESAVVQYCCVQGGWPGKRNISGFPLFVDPSRGDYHLQNGSPCIDQGLRSIAPATDIEGRPRPGDDARVDLGAYETPDESVPSSADPPPRVYYVNATAPEWGDGSSWKSAFQSIHAALEISKPSDEIWVAAGTYQECIFLEPGVTLLGGFPSEGSPSLEQRDWSAHATVTEVTGLGKYSVVGADHATLDGFTILGNEDDWEGGVYCSYSSPVFSNCAIINNQLHDKGDGVYCAYSSPVFSNCTITNNGNGIYCSYASPVFSNCTIAHNRGGGVYCRFSFPEFANCVIAHNEGGNGGGMYCTNSSPILTDCTIDNNQSERGGGMYCSSSSPTLTNCTIDNNTVSYTGGGMYCHSSFPILTNCSISYNETDNGAGIYCSISSPALTNCIISNNQADELGGGAYCYRSSPSLINCTLFGNQSGEIGGALYCNISSPSLTNCILWNRGEDIGGTDVSGIVMRYCCIQGGWPGTGNFSAPPLFVDSSGGDYHLQNGSPCIDRGLLSAAPAADVEGNTRPGGDGKVDIGAYESPDEYEPGSLEPTPRVLYVNAAAPEGGNGRSWATAFRSIHAALEISSSSDEVWVAAGTYEESIHMEPGVSLLGGFPSEGSPSLEQREWINHETIVDGTGLTTPVVYGAESARFDGFSVVGGSPGVLCQCCSPVLSHCSIRGYSGQGVSCYLSSPTLISCTIDGEFRAESGRGLHCVESSPILRSCRIDRNRNKLYTGGVYCNSSSPIFINCIVSRNRGGYRGGGVYLVNSPLSKFIHCTISGNESIQNYGGIYCSNSFLTLTNCILWNAGEELGGDSADQASLCYCCVQGGWKGEGNSFLAPLFVNSSQGDYHMQNGSPCIDRGLLSAAPATDIEGHVRPGDDGKVDIGAYESPDDYESAFPRVLCVNAGAPEGGNGLTWATALRSIQAALDISTASHEIWVAAGRYNENIQMVPYVALYGGFPADGSPLFDQRDASIYKTIIDATGFNTHAVVAAQWALLDGFMITGGNAEENGGGVYCAEPFILRNCTITNNIARKRSGCGIYCKGCSPTIEDCTISENSKIPYYRNIVLDGSVYCDFGSSPVITRCVIQNNSDYGIHLRYSSATITECVIKNNYRYGIILDNNVFHDEIPPTTVEDCLVSGNTEKGIYLIGLNTRIAVSRTRITGNLGTGFSCNDAMLCTLDSCLLTDNQGVGFACSAGDWDPYVDPILYNCTLARNALGDFYFSFIFGEGFYKDDFYMPSSLPELKNCIFWSDDAVSVQFWYHTMLWSGNNIPKTRNFSTMQYDYVDVSPDWGEGIDIYFSSVKGGWPGNISDDPRFVNPEAGDFRLLSNSPCIDRGDNSSAHNLPYDIEGGPRILDGDGNGTFVVDMGAYEFNRLAPVPTFTPTLTPTPDETSYNPPATSTPVPLRLWILDGYGRVRFPLAATPTPAQ